MRDDRRRPTIVGGLVIAVEVAVVPPAVFVDDLAARAKAIRTIDAIGNKPFEASVKVVGPRRQVGDRAGSRVPFRRGPDARRTVYPGEGGLAGRAEAQPDGVGFLLTPLQFEEVAELAGKQ